MIQHIVLFTNLVVLLKIIDGSDTTTETSTVNIQSSTDRQSIVPPRCTSNGSTQVSTVMLPLLCFLAHKNESSGYFGSKGAKMCPYGTPDNFSNVNFAQTPADTWGLRANFCNNSIPHEGDNVSSPLKYCAKDGQWDRHQSMPTFSEILASTKNLTVLKIACYPDQLFGNVKDDWLRNITKFQIYLMSLALSTDFCTNLCLQYIDRLLSNGLDSIQKILNSWDNILKAIENNIFVSRRAYTRTLNSTSNMMVTYSDMNASQEGDVAIRFRVNRTISTNIFVYSYVTIDIVGTNLKAGTQISCGFVTFPKATNFTLTPMAGFFCDGFTPKSVLSISLRGNIGSVAFECSYQKLGTAVIQYGAWIMLNTFVIQQSNNRYECPNIPGWNETGNAESNRYCPPVVAKNLTFPRTKLGSWAIPLEFCLQSNFTPVVRKCFSNGTWGDIVGECAKNVTMSSITSELRDLLYCDAAANEEKIVDDSKMLSLLPTKEFRSVDVHLVASILETFNKHAIQIDQRDFFQTANNLMQINKTVLMESQTILNATDHILCCIDTFLQKTTPKNLFFPNLTVTNVDVTENIVGIMLSNKTVTLLHEEDYNAILTKSRFEIAVVVKNFQQAQKYKVAVFENDHLFNVKDIQNQSSVNSLVISVLGPKGTMPNNTRIAVYFKQLVIDVYSSCNYWKYGTDQEDQPTYGRWLRDSKALPLKHGYFYCEFDHLTHFGLLLSDSFTDSYFLDVITIFGSVMSLIGIAVIFATACTFKKWRNNSSNIVVLNIAVCLLLVIVLFFASDYIPPGHYCIAAGIVLHYLLLAQFFWMLAICFSNYRKLVVVFNIYIDRIISKYCLFCWGCPVPIVVGTAVASLETYDKDELRPQLCYPKDIYLKLGFVLPAAIILTINLIAYIFIIKNITRTFNVTTHVLTKSYSAHKFLLLMFFMMGFTWIFGILAAVTAVDFFLYLFCVTSTFQGFVMFVFFILDSSETADLWKGKMGSGKASKASLSGSM